MLPAHEWQVLKCVVDADPNTNDARQFARRFPGYVALCRYRRGVPQREMQVTETDEYRTEIVTVGATASQIFDFINANNNGDPNYKQSYN